MAFVYDHRLKMPAKAKAREEVICFCGVKCLEKNLKAHHDRAHEGKEISYSLVPESAQQTLSFGQPPSKQEKLKRDV